MKVKKYEYFNAAIRKAEQILELQSLEEFVRYAAANHIYQIIKTRDFETQSPCFALASKGALYICTASGFENLEDYMTATEGGFPDAATFYSARSNNCATYHEYTVAVASGVTDAALMAKMKEQGYFEGFKMFEELRRQKTNLPQLQEVTNVKQLYDFAQQKSFEDFKHFLKVWEAGFTDPLLHQAAVEKGLNDAAQYEAFKKGGFNAIEEFKTANENGITSRDELAQFLDLSAANFDKASFDERLLLGIVSKLENNTTTGFGNLYSYFLKTEELYKRSNGSAEPKLPGWYTKRLRSEGDVKKFLAESDFVKRFGTYDAEKEIFETIHINRRKVVVDGSNVAHNSDKVDRKAGIYHAELKNIVKLVKKLKEEYGFEDIHVIADYSLHARSRDKEVLREIKSLCRFTETPQGIPADLYLINQVKKHHCLLITNDTFSDWKMREKWVEDNINFYRVRFVINGDTVLLPHMERFDKHQ